MNSKDKNAVRLVQAGFTLIEIMVALAIGMLLTIVIVQTMSVFEAQKRTTTGTADAQTNGGIALYDITREMQLSGFPLVPVTDSPLECATVTWNGTASTISRFSPVSITNGVAAAGVSASDAVTIRYGTSAMGGVPTQITAAAVGNDAPVSSNLGCKTGDVSVIVSGGTCSVSTVTGVSATGVTPIAVMLADISGVVSGANLSCLGAWNEVTFAVNNGNLERNGVPVVPGIVNLQAQYGISNAANSNQVAQWVDPSGVTWAVPTTADRNRIKAIRIAVVARNAKQEIGNVSEACRSTTASAPTGLCAWEGSPASPAPAIDLSAGDPDWQRYRYRVYETIVPIRNVIWAKDTL